MPKKKTKAWLAVSEFLNDKSTDNFLEIIHALRNGNLLEADREKLLMIEPSELVLVDDQYPAFERKFINALLGLRFDVDFGKISKYLENRKKNDVDPATLGGDGKQHEIVSEELQQALKAMVDAERGSVTFRQAIISNSHQKLELQAGELLPFFESSSAMLSTAFETKTLSPLVDCAREISAFYKDRLFTKEDYSTYVESKSKKELRWIISVFQAIATRYLAKAEKTEDHSQITHLVLFVSFHLNLLHALHYPESIKPLDFEKKIIDECEAYKQPFLSFIELIPLFIPIYLHMFALEDSPDVSLFLMAIAFQSLQGSRDCKSEITLVLSRAIITSSHETEGWLESRIYLSLRDYCIEDALQEIPTDDRLMEKVDTQIGDLELSAELAKSLNWGAIKYRRRIEECIRDVGDFYWEDDHQDQLKRLWIRLVGIYEKIGLLDDPQKMEFGFGSENDSSYFNPPSSIRPNIITAGYLFISHEFDTDFYSCPEVWDYFHAVDAFQNAGMLGNATKIFCFSLFHIFTRSEHSFDRKLGLFREIEDYFEKLEQVSLRQYLPIILYAISEYEKAGAFEEEPLTTLWLNDVLGRFPLENVVVLQKTQPEESEDLWYQDLLEKGVGSIKIAHINSVSKLRKLINEKHADRYQILYENLRISDAISAYLNSIQSILYDIFDESFQKLGLGKLSAEFSAIRAFSGEREISYSDDVNWEWIVHLNNVLRRSSLKRGPEFENFLKAVAKQDEDPLSRFLHWLSNQDLNNSIRTIQKERNNNAHRRAQDKSPVVFAMVNLIDSFFRIELGRIVKESRYLESINS